MSTAHASTADLAAHSAHFSRLFSSRVQPSSLGALAVPTWVSQQLLHAMVQALYAKQLSLDSTTAEPILRAAHALEMPCIVKAAAGFVARHFLPDSPGEVSLCTGCTWQLVWPTRRRHC